ncbi:hypothetical protein Pint_17135 [Pistacia integerrima]|uniref:Uncharacterized protein n=1 Tax=Pistacia integerrima TaxID=434235 RepID=A0ACC0YVE3_9ROSI|nr:hypothetical protein Pint_17135 [Pistacia integerrima]
MKMNPISLFVLILLVQLKLSVVVLGNNVPPKPATNKAKRAPKTSPPEANLDKTLAPSLIRLHFHDCVVRGCDASILLNYRGSERRTKASKTLRGYKVINDIKSEVERQCPKTVSCADILTAVARDATLLAGGPFWEVPFGRKDGRISINREANRLVPQGNENITTLINLFESKGLNILDLVVLSGSHTIGRSSCSPIHSRLYNFNGTQGASDPSLDRKYSRILKQKCGPSSYYNTLVDLDATTPRTFDIKYYENLQKKMGLLSTDQSLYSDERSSSFVDTLVSQPSLFSIQFAASMVKLGNVGVLTRPHEGEIRLHCDYVNP